MENEHAVGEVHELGDVGRVEQDATPRALLASAGRLRLGPDVDPARGVVHQQQLRVLGEHAAEDHLLLVAARQRRHLLAGTAHRDVELRHRLADQAAHPRG